MRLQKLILILYFALYAIFSFATTFNPQPFPETVQNAPVIVRGKIGMSYPEWGKDGEGTKRIYTYYELQVAEVLKGNASSQSLIMRELGGEKDGVGLQISGTAQFSRGEDVVVFLRDKNSDGSFDVQGMMMGKYNIQTDSDGKEFLTGMGISMNAGNTGMYHEEDAQNQNHPSSRKKWTLESLRQLIKSQGSEPVSTTQHVSKPVPKSSPTPTVSSSPLFSPTPSAPLLQPTQSEESPTPRGLLFYFAVGLGMLGLFGLINILRRKK